MSVWLEDHKSIEFLRPTGFEDGDGIFTSKDGFNSYVAISFNSPWTGYNAEPIAHRCYICLSNRKFERLSGPLDEILAVFVHKYNVIMPHPNLMSFDSRDRLPRRWLLHWFFKLIDFFGVNITSDDHLFGCWIICTDINSQCFFVHRHLQQCLIQQRSFSNCSNCKAILAIIASAENCILD